MWVGYVVAMEMGVSMARPWSDDDLYWTALPDLFQRYSGSAIPLG